MSAARGLDELVRPTTGDPDGALVLLHGRGADEHDLVPLDDALDPGRRLVGVTPGAPLRLPPGGRHWYRLHQIGSPDRETFAAALELVGPWLDGLPAALGVPWERIVLGGFSQGAVMTYALGLGRGRPRPAGLIALSGFIPSAEGFALDLDDLAGYPVAIGHGLHDQIIGVEWGRLAQMQLRTAGARVLYRETAMAHTIDPAFVRELHGWLDEVVPAGT